MSKFIETFGALPFIEDVRDYRLKKATGKEDFPIEFTLDKIAVKNQGSVGSCVAHSIAEVIEYHNKKQEKNNILMSTGFIYGNRRNSLSKSSGMYVREALSNACKYGDVYKADFNENKEVPEAIELFEQRFDKLKDKAYPNRFSTYFRLTSDDEIKRALMNYGPVVFAVNWRKDAYVDFDGILHLDTKKEKTGGHCMIIYGWNEKGWKIQNSWGMGWGINGYAILPFNAKKTEVWGITDEVINNNEDIERPFSNTSSWIAKFLNWLINLFKKKK